MTDKKNYPAMCEHDCEHMTGYQSSACAAGFCILNAFDKKKESTK